MLSLTTKIMSALVPGCALGKTIYEDVKAYAASEDSFKQTLNKLRQEGLVQSAQYAAPGTGNPCALYALSEAGAIFLAENHHYRRDQIRTMLPAKNMIAHELGVVEIVRTILWEMLRIPYNCDYFDDIAFKANKKHLQLSGWVPDLLLKITEVKGQYCEAWIALELDMGSRKLADVLQTVLGRNCATLFICSTTERMNELWRALAAYDDLNGMIYFSLLSVFCGRPGGIFSINWRALDGRTVGLYPTK